MSSAFSGVDIVIGFGQLEQHPTLIDDHARLQQQSTFQEIFATWQRRSIKKIARSTQF